MQLPDLTSLKRIQNHQPTQVTKFEARNMSPRYTTLRTVKINISHLRPFYTQLLFTVPEVNHYYSHISDCKYNVKCILISKAFYVHQT